MVGVAGTNIAVRTTVMIGALVVLLLMALLPGPLSWLVGSSRGDGTGREAVGKRAAGTASGPEATAGGPAVPGPTNFGDSVQPLTVDPQGAPGTEEPRSAAAPAPVGALPASAGPRAPAERCSEITSELCRLGAAYFRLESWADEPQVFRFQCTLPLIGASTPETTGYRTFEASAADPATAMQRVLADVQAWQTTRR
jgi:hypothetical protein